MLRIKTRSSLAVITFLVTTGCASMGDAPGPPPPGAFTAEVRPLVVGYSWAVQDTFFNESKDRTSSNAVIWTVVGEGTLNDRPILRVSDGSGSQIFDRETRGWMAALDRQGREIVSHSPSDAQISSPLWVGKEWVARFTRHERLSDRIIHDVVVVWKVAAYEAVTVPAGTFKAFRLEAWTDRRDPLRKRIYWFAPDVGLVVKELREGYGGPPMIGWRRDSVQSTTELLEYAMTTDVATLTAALQNETRPGGRAGAGRALGEALARPGVSAAEADAALGALRAALKDPAGDIARIAVQALATAARRYPDAIRALTEALGDPAFRLNGLWMLAKIGAPARPAVPVIVDILKTGPGTIHRVAALNALRTIGFSSTEVPAVLDALRDPDATIRGEATASLPQIVGLVEQDLKNPDADTRGQAVRSLRRVVEAIDTIGPAALNVAVPLRSIASGDYSPEVRALAERGLQRIVP